MIGKEIILLGGGGHCKSCIDVIEQEDRYKIIGILDQPSQIGKLILDYEVIGTDNDIKKYVSKGYSFLITVGQIKTASLRQSLFKLLEGYNAKIVTVISPRAYVSTHARVGKGVILMHDVIVNADASVGDNCIINSKALIEHDTRIEKHCHISTGAIVNGGVTIKEGSFFGSNAVSKEYVKTSNNAFIKAGSLFKG